ncbi:hypothetical protein TIFTF001_017483 [Ficus carica]|uniref:Uncharacterized protein n=1 Tax=Ficus carica TaxID=3494 RepID=A0AA88AAR7_FICCA|nr:hypothetical protein TIFTF001_017483 [Ficus carica]
MDYDPRPVQPLVIGFSAVLENLGMRLAASELFLLGNSMGFAASLNVIPFQRELHISIFSMMFAYSWSLHDFKSTHGGYYKQAILDEPLVITVDVHYFHRLHPLS